MRWHDEHVKGCELCCRQIADPQPFHEDLCHMNIRPGDDYGELPPIQCPHLAGPGSETVRLCMGHLESAARSWVRLVTRTAPLN